jgi:hypothetical protein
VAAKLTSRSTAVWRPGFKVTAAEIATLVVRARRTRTVIVAMIDTDVDFDETEDVGRYRF